MKLISLIALRAIGFVVARPKLDYFLRQRIFRHAALASFLRRTAARSRQQGWRLSDTPVLSEDAQLPDSAKEVLQDLRQAIQRCESRK